MNESERRIAISKLHDAKVLLLQLAKITARWKAPIMALGTLNRVIEDLDPNTVCPVCNDETVIDVTDGGATPCPLCTDLYPPVTLDDLPF